MNILIIPALKIRNSNLDADKISITTTGDTNIRGGNVHADSELTASIGGDLNVDPCRIAIAPKTTRQV